MMNLSEYVIQLDAGLCNCVKCKRLVKLYARVLSRDPFGSPIIEQKRAGQCDGCRQRFELPLTRNMPLSKGLLKSTESPFDSGPEGC